MIRKIIKDFIPPILFKIKRRFNKETKWNGNYRTWKDASDIASGYDDDIIVNKVEKTMNKVLANDNLFERDGVILQKKEYSFPLLSGLMWIAASNQGNLNLIDFGGSLASMYYQYRLFLQNLNTVNWSVVEQAIFVETAKKMNFESNINFYSTIEDCLKHQKSESILLGSVLPYIEKPYDLLEYIVHKSFKYIVIDRTWILLAGGDQLTIQKNPTPDYSSYPCWFFNSEHFESVFTKDYDLVVKYTNSSRLMQIDGKSRAIGSGYIFRRKQD